MVRTQRNFDHSRPTTFAACFPGRIARVLIQRFNTIDAAPAALHRRAMFALRTSLTLVSLLATLAGCSNGPTGFADSGPADVRTDVHMCMYNGMPIAVGASCGGDFCLPENASCQNCGALSIDTQCRCVTHGLCGAIPECGAPTLAQEGEYCGSNWWCDRDCDNGLTCVAESADAGPMISYRTVCRRQ